MNMKKILSMLMAVAMVLSMVVVPVAAEGEENPYTITLSGPNGESSVTAEPGTTVDIYMTSSGDCVPGWTATGGWVSYPEGWTIKTTNKFSLAMMLDGVDSPLFNNNDDINPAMVAWACSGTTHGGTTDWSLLTLTGQMAILTFTIPEDAQPGTYDLTIANGEGRDKTNFASIADENGVITDFMHADDLAVNFVGCSVVIPAAEVVPAECPDHGEVTWTDLAVTGGALTTGHYKLADNVDLTAALTVAADQTVCIDLAGKNLTQTTTLTRVFEIEAGGSLTIIDSVGTGVISGGQTTKGTASLGGNILNAGTFTLYGGTISGGQSQTNGTQAAYARGGNIYGQAGSVINIKGGTVTGGKAFKNGSYTGTNGWIAGGNIYTAGALNISGGTISDGDVSHSYTLGYNNRPLRLYGGNIYLAAGAAMNVTGGTISGGTLSGVRTDNTLDASTNDHAGSDSFGYGGSIFATDATVNISGGTITGGKIDIDLIVAASGTSTYTGNNGKGLEILGGNLYVMGGSLTVTGGTIEKGSLVGDVSTGSAATSTGFTRLCAQGANIYVNGADLSITGGTIADGSITANSTNSVEGAGSVGVAGGAGIYVGSCTSATIAGDAVVTGGTVTSTITASTVDKDDDSKGGNIFVDDTTLTVGGNAVISDGTITVNQSASRGANVYIATGAVLELKDNATVTGGVSGPDEGDARGGNIFVVGTLNMYGGTISDGYAGWGSNVMLQYGAKMNMYGGQITGGTGSASILDQRGTVKIFDGVIRGADDGNAALAVDGTSTTNGGNAYIFGGKVDSAKVNRQSYLHVLGGYLKGLTVNSGINGTAYIYNGVTGFDPTEYLSDCATTAGTETFVTWHAVGADCATCAHDFVADGGAACDSDTCGVAHIANICVHEFVDGVCSKCEFAAPAHTASCTHGCASVTWTPWNGTVEAGGHYYLVNDVQLSEVVSITEGTVCIDLNGYTMTGPIAGRAFYVNEGTVLNLMDSSAENTGTVAGAGFILKADGGMVYINGGALNLYDATVTGGIVDEDRGGNIYVYGGVMVLDNGKIVGGTIAATASAARGGNLCNYGGDVVIKGADAKIVDGYASSESSTNVYGGNYYAGTGGNLYFYDGEISGGYALIGGNVVIMNGTVEKKWNSVNYMYGGLVGDVHEDASANSNFVIYGGTDFANDFYMFGGQINNLKDNNGGNEKVIYAGVLTQDPTTIGKNGTSLLAACSCFTYDEETGLYTVGHLNGAATCGNCSANDGGFAAGYSEAFTYTNLATHTYAADATVCSNCACVVAKIGDTEYSELTVALDAAEATDTVVLVKDAFVNGDLDIYTTLDLNGKTLNASGIVSAENNDAAITDSVGTGSATGSEVKMHNGNGMLAIDEKNDGVYTYETVTVCQKLESTAADEANIKFYIENDEDNTKLDEAIKAGSDVKIRLTVTWNSGANVHHFNYSDDLVEQYLSDWDNKMFTCTITSMPEDATVTAEVLSGNVVVAAYEYAG